jgi:hypothetical protein
MADSAAPRPNQRDRSRLFRAIKARLARWISEKQKNR